MEKRINRTLMDKLFDNPTPLEDKSDAFSILYNRLFPDKLAFKYFLSTNNYDEQIQVSKVIIQRICFESNYPPAYDLLVNLLQYESTDENQAQLHSYTPQDHFVHIVNSYIFGIYLYFYHPILGAKLTKYFIGARKKDRNTNPVLNATKDFISFWKYFCLFHDVAYPIEGAFRYSCDKNDEIFFEEERRKKVEIKRKSKESLKYVTAFLNLQNFNIKEWGAAAVARYLTVLDLFYDETNKTADELFLNHKVTYIHHSSENESTISDFSATREIAKNYVCIEKLFSYEHFKLLSGFIKPEDTLIVIVDTHTLIPVAFKYYTNHIKKVYIISQSRYIDKLDTSIEDVFEEEEDYFSSRFTIRFCIKNPLDKFKAITPSWGSGRLTIDEINEIRKKIFQKVTVNGIPSDSHVRFANITDASELDDYSFEIFRNVFEYIGNTFIEKESISVFEQIVKLGTTSQFQEDLRKSIARSEIPNISRYLCGLLNEIISDSINCSVRKSVNQIENLEAAVEDENQFMSIFEAPITTILSDFISKFRGNRREEIEKELIKLLYDKVHGCIEAQNHACSSTIQFLSEFLLKIYNPIYISNPQICDAFFGALDDMPWQKLPCITLFDNVDYPREIVHSIDEVVTKISSDKLTAESLCQEYMNRNVALDHGIWGGYVYLISELITYYSIDTLFNSSEKISLASAIPYFIWPICPNAYEIKLKNKYDLISKETAKAIFVHNIYGDYIREIPSIRKETTNIDMVWKIDLNTEPCVYFALLVDALQKWDRRKYFSPKLGLSSLYEADTYDIQIVDKKLLISLRCHSRDINSINYNFREVFDSYLICASELIELSIVQ